ncbi:general secretion pathway protein GspB [Alicycliphilus denitrificans]|uniref:general secretion pathway protein GspB n=1 Tax=Alicycliphilus denitrificans TaxID=179636 RepID=UPI00217ED8F0|nr:general secretion pathway protein GspB [Alicycliphilus denitrificans]
MAVAHAARARAGGRRSVHPCRRRGASRAAGRRAGRARTGACRRNRIGGAARAGRAAATPAQPAARAERRAADAAPAAKAPPPRSAPPKPTEAPAAPVFAQADLPPAVREQLPTLQLAGLTYSSNPLYRMVIVNRQVLHEGDQAAPGLVLERIEPGRTIWSFRGYRYALPVQ